MQNLKFKIHNSKFEIQNSKFSIKILHLKLSYCESWWGFIEDGKKEFTEHKNEGGVKISNSWILE